MTPEVANDALNVTLDAVQSLIKCCVDVKQGDSEALRLSDEIARRVARDLKVYGGDTTSFSPLLLSCAPVICQHSKSGVFQTLPDWNSVVENDSCIKSHPQFHKTMGYGPLPAIAMPEVQATELSLNLPDNLPSLPPEETPIDEAASYKAHYPPLTLAMELKMLQPLKLQVFSDTDTTPSIVQNNHFVQGNYSNSTMGRPAGKKRKAAHDNDNLADKPMPLLLRTWMGLLPMVQKRTVLRKGCLRQAVPPSNKKGFWLDTGLTGLIPYRAGSRVRSFEGAPLRQTIIRLLTRSARR
ncbi:hypothetical protein EDD22DRAFT_957201 [Suillus occidentalis]|nr:hypothetical protein EDD22DRAFT_957201 [Suillus occidentalis]